MNTMTKASLLAVALSFGGSAYAQNSENVPAPPSSYPVCSKTITDECINPDAVPHAARKMPVHHRATRIVHRTAHVTHHKTRVAARKMAKPEARS